MEYTQIEFQDLQSDVMELLIAQLNELGFEGFEEQANNLKAFIKSDDFDESSFNMVVQQHALNFVQTTVKETNWNQQWESDFEPITVILAETEKPFAFVRASFHQPNPAATFDLLITPKMSFGTGHHATTYQMMEQMSKIDFTGKTVIDFGTGTGLLAILAEKMGAASITGIDNDDWSIENAKENISANDCTKINIIKADSCINLGVKADVMLANINLNIIIENLSAIKENCKSHAIILFSGVLIEDKEKITAAIENKGMTITSVFNKNNWLVISCLCN